MKKLMSNRRARYEYEILQEFDAGMVLMGSEVKSIREGNANLTDAFIYVKDGEVWLKNFTVARYKHNHSAEIHIENRDKKLLLKRKEINKISKELDVKGITAIPLSIFISKNRLKINFGIGKGKKLWDKKESIKSKDIERDMKREISYNN